MVPPKFMNCKISPISKFLYILAPLEFSLLTPKFEKLSNLINVKWLFCPFKNGGFHILFSLKKFHPQNLEYNTGTNQTKRNSPLLKISPHAPQYQLSLMPTKSHHALEYLGNHNLKSQLHYLPEKSSQSSSNPWLSLAIHNEYEPFCCIPYDQRSMMPYLSSLAHS